MPFQKKRQKERKPKPLHISKSIAKRYFTKLEAFEDAFDERVAMLECSMQMETGIDDLEFFRCDGGIVGIGNASRTMKLIHR